MTYEGIGNKGGKISAEGENRYSKQTTKELQTASRDGLLNIPCRCDRKVNHRTYYMSVHSFKEFVILLISSPAPFVMSAGPQMSVVAAF